MWDPAVVLDAYVGDAQEGVVATRREPEASPCRCHGCQRAVGPASTDHLRGGSPPDLVLPMSRVQNDAGGLR